VNASFARLVRIRTSAPVEIWHVVKTWQILWLLLTLLLLTVQNYQRDALNIIYSSNITYLLTPWSRVLLEKLTGSAASQEIPRQILLF